MHNFIAPFLQKKHIDCVMIKIPLLVHPQTTSITFWYPIAMPPVLPLELTNMENSFWSI